MKTHITFPAPERSELRRIIVGYVEDLLGGQAAEHEIQDATAALVDAFDNANRQMGEGIGYVGHGDGGAFYATANISTGYFTLYRNVE